MNIKSTSNKSKEIRCFELAEKLYEKRKYKIAEKFYRKTIKLNPKNDNCYIKIGFCHLFMFYSEDLSYSKIKFLNKYILFLNIKLFKKAYNIKRSEQNLYYKAKYLFLIGNINSKYYKKALKIINNLISINENEKYYYLRSKIYLYINENILALEDINYCIKKNPISKYYSFRYDIFSKNRSYIEAHQDLKKAIELEHNYNNYIKLGNYYDFYENNLNKAITQYNEAEFINNKDSTIFNNRAQCYYRLNDFNNALKDFLRCVDIVDKSNFLIFDYYEKIAKCYLLLDNVNKSIEYYSYCIEYCKRNNRYNYFLLNSLIFRSYCYFVNDDIIFAKKDFIKAIKVYSKTKTINKENEFIDNYEEIFSISLQKNKLSIFLKLLKFYFHKDYSSLFDIDKIILYVENLENIITKDNFSIEDIISGLKNQKFIKDEYLNQIIGLSENEYISYTFDNINKDNFHILIDEIKYRIIKFISSGFVSKKGHFSKFLNNIANLLYEILQRDYLILIKQKEQEKARVIIEERDKVIADLSHSIKNLIATVKDPLENLKIEAKEYTKTIDDAINGTKLIKGIVNAMNLSYVGSIEDFYEDAKSEDENKIAIKDIMINAIISAVPNMFDKKYFNDFQKRYFPTREIFIEATSEWQKVSQKKEPKEIIEYLNKYMFDIKLDFVNIDGLTLSDKKGSVVKMMILLQEMILNAIKYSSFVDRDRRIVNISIEKSDNIKIEVENRYKKDIVTKKSGLGHVIINNFAKLLKTEPLITTNNDIFKIELNIPDLWR